MKKGNKKKLSLLMINEEKWNREQGGRAGYLL
jgi:hypothetical protein